RGPGYGTVVGVYVGDQILRDEALEVSHGYTTGVERAEVPRLAVGQHEDHFGCALGERAFSRLRHVDFAHPLLRADEIAVKRVDDRVAARRLLVVARRQDDVDLAIRGIDYEVSYERRGVAADRADPNFAGILDHGRFAARHMSRCDGGTARQQQRRTDSPPGLRIHGILPNPE